MVRVSRSWGLVCAALILGAAAWGVYAARRDVRRAEAAVLAEQAAAAKARRELEAALAAAQRRPAETVPSFSRVSPPGQPSATELLQRLALLRPIAGPERNHTLREVIYYLEALERVGEPAVPVIREFLARFEDVAYDPDTAPPEETETPSAAPGNARENVAERDRDRALLQQLGRALQSRGQRRPLPRMNYDFPPTLRIGLLDSLRDIASESAEATVAEVMQRSSRALEVAYAAKTLKAMSGDRWREAALATAHELLQHPPEAASAARVDRRAEDYYYAVLDLFADTSFAELAGQRLVRDDGTLDRGSLNYLTRALQQNALPTFQSVFNDPRVTNVVDRAVLLQQALPYLGADPYADSMFTSVVTNPAFPGPARQMVLQALVREGSEDEPLDLARVQQRYDLLQGLKSQLEPDAYRRVNASLAKQLGIPVPAEDTPRARRRDSGGPPTRRPGP